jgi:ABC-type amino acid transport substrate-binding protein
MDGEITSTIAADDFPLAKTISIPNNSALAQLFMNVADKKADMTFGDMNAYYQYNQNNPGKLKVAFSGTPVRVFPFAYAVAKGEFELLSLLNYTLTEMLYSGQIESIIRKHELFPNSYLYINTPYRKE